MRLSLFAILTAIISLFLSLMDQGSDYKTMNDQDTLSSSCVTLFLCGDVMTGRGLDQVLPNSVDPRIYEPYVKDAREYVRLAEKANGPIDQPVSYSYIWGDAIEVWKQIAPAFKIINLETSITSYDQPLPGRGINYRMHPDNVQVLTCAGINFCSQANNHILDWDLGGLRETIQTLKNAGIKYAGAGIDLNEASNPAQLKMAQSRVIIFAFGSETSGIPKNWTATSGSPGLNLLPLNVDEALSMISKQVKAIKQSGDIVVLSVHWGSNWGYNIPVDQRNLAHSLIDYADVDIIYSHSSHHPRGIEVYKNKLILYGTGDFINDYEGIIGYEKQYRNDLTLMYFPCIDPSNGNLVSMIMVPMQIKNFRLAHVSVSDADWLCNILNRVGSNLGTRITLDENHYFSLHWD